METDIANCFEAIPHDRLMQAVEERVCDQGVLKLLRRDAARRGDGGRVGPPTGHRHPAGRGGLPVAGNIYLHRVDRAWDVARARGAGAVCRRPGGDVHVSRHRPRLRLARLTVLLAELGLEPKAAKTRIVHLQVGGEGFDFLGFHHRLVRSQGRTGDGAAWCSWPAGPRRRRCSMPATGSVSSRTGRRLLLPVEWVTRGRQPVPARLGRVLPVSATPPTSSTRSTGMPGCGWRGSSPAGTAAAGRSAGTCSTIGREPARPGRSHWNRRRTQTLPGLAGKAECRR